MTSLEHHKAVKDAGFESVGELLAAWKRLMEQEPKWVTDGTLPVIKKYTDKYFIVAVKRVSGKVFTFPATFCNDYPINVEYGAETCQGNGWQQRTMNDEESDDGNVACTGWYKVESSDGDYSSVYEHLLKDGEQLIAWREVPQYAAPKPDAQPTPIWKDHGENSGMKYPEQSDLVGGATDAQPTIPTGPVSGDIQTELDELKLLYAEACEERDFLRKAIASASQPVEKT